MLILDLNVERDVQFSISHSALRNIRYIGRPTGLHELIL